MSLATREAAVWAFLESKTAYTDLGLRQYKGHLGEVMPFDPETGRIPATALPAHVSDVEVTGGTEETDLQSGIEEIHEVTHHLIYPARQGDTGRATMDAAGRVLSDLLLQQAGYNAIVGTVGGDVGWYEWSEGETDLVASKEGLPLFWRRSFTLTLFGIQQFITR